MSGAIVTASTEAGELCERIDWALELRLSRDAFADAFAAVAAWDLPPFQHRPATTCPGDR